MSSSPASKRNLKPSPISPAAQHFGRQAHDPAAAAAVGIHPLTQSVEPFGPFSPLRPTGPNQQLQQQHQQHQQQQQQHPQQQHFNTGLSPLTPQGNLGPPQATMASSPPNPRKRRASGQQANQIMHPQQHIDPTAMSPPGTATQAGFADPSTLVSPMSATLESPIQQPPVKKGRTNTPWTPAEELRLKKMRDAGNTWSEIAKTFPTRTEGSVKKHWYKDMHYAEFAEDESAALLAAIKEYEQQKWKVIGAKVGKPAKACEQYAKEHFGGRV
jgi:hypothetical protein